MRVLPSAYLQAALSSAVLESWSPLLTRWAQSDAGATLIDRLDRRHREGAEIAPDHWFKALELVPLSRVRVVILGQDPYHGPGQAQGLAFSVSQGQRLPPSLRNILSEAVRDTGSVLPTAATGDLSVWAQQGVLLLNSALTVELGHPGAHLRWGWDALTTGVLRAVLSDAVRSERAIVGLLWGASAHGAASHFERASLQGARCLVLLANHPSPLAARRPPRPFVGCGHFSAATRFLQSEHPDDSVLTW